MIRRLLHGFVPSVGTRSVLIGAHCFLLHPWFVAAAWWHLFGFPWDPRLWVMFFVHDLGYVGKPNMDGPEGETHVELGAWIMSLFDRWAVAVRYEYHGYKHVTYRKQRTWQDLSLYHSRFYAKRDKAKFSKLCVADKLALVYTPGWLYLPMVRLTGEIEEYMALAKTRTEAGELKYASMQLSTTDEERWYRDVQEYLRRWVAEHKDMREDTWTPTAREAKTSSGVWR